MHHQLLPSPLNKISDKAMLNNGTSDIKERENKAKYSDSRTLKENNGYPFGEHSSPETYILNEIGHVPGQKWPHNIIRKRNSFKYHCPLQV